jgi:hypothetical protein
MTMDDIFNSDAVAVSDITAHQRLRAFEDEHIGEDAVRNKHGHIEKGFGSKFKDMSPERHAEYAALEKIVAAEDKVNAANAALSTAQAEHDAAVEQLDLLTKRQADAPERQDGPTEAEKAHAVA